MKHETKEIWIAIIGVTGIFAAAISLVLLGAHFFLGFNGITLVNPTVKVETVMATTTVATEASNCKAQGGEFSISNKFGHKELQACQKDDWCIATYSGDAIGYILTCTRPEKELSSVTITI